MTDTETTLAALKQRMAEFVHQRAWEKYHRPKNLAMSLAIEAAELMEPLRWLTPKASWAAAREEPTKSYLRKEMADVLLVLLSLADYLGVDLLAAALEKLEENRARYPAELARGRADKYTAYVKKKG